MNGMLGNECSEATNSFVCRFCIFVIFICTVLSFFGFGWLAGSYESNRLQENTVYVLPDGNKIKIQQEGKNSVIMPANEIVKDK